MSETKWTKGPWEVGLVLGLPRVAQLSGKIVADICFPNIQAVQESREIRAEVAANANLIAQAPSLYEALESCVTLIRNEINTKPIIESAEFDSALATLAKARG